MPVLLPTATTYDRVLLERELIEKRLRTPAAPVDQTWSRKMWHRYFFAEMFPNLYKNFPQWRFLFEVAMEMRLACPPGSTILDIGAGECRYKQLLSHCSYTAFDFALTGAQYDFSKLDFIGDACRIPLGDGSFDAAMSFAVMEHVPSMETASAEMARVVRSGGTCHVIFPLARPEHMVPYDFFRSTRYGIRSVFAKVGLDIVEIRASNGSLWTAVNYLWLAALDGPARGRGKRNLARKIVKAAWATALMPLMLYAIATDRRYPDDFPIYYYVKAVKK
ncbi:MAG: class I SAM-dependent methyltransferase [Acidobacteria bacterium]|nr:class I SAM-dependent methyltransferase [Acidobacteriota bacterium]